MLDDKRVKAAFNVYQNIQSGNHGPLTPYGLVQVMLDADDLWRREHPPKLTEDWRDSLADRLRVADKEPGNYCTWDISSNKDYWRRQAEIAFAYISAFIAPAPHDAAKEKTMSPGDREEHLRDPYGDAAGEEREPELPKNIDCREGEYYDSGTNSRLRVHECTADELESIARHMRYRQRLQDKREKEAYVSDAMMDAAYNTYYKSIPGITHPKESMRRAIAAALEARKEGGSK